MKGWDRRAGRFPQLVAARWSAFAPRGFGETSRRSALELTARGGGWRAALDGFRNWLIREAAA